MINTSVGNYKLLRPLGEGGMGVVFEAEHLSMGRKAAVKVLRRDLARDEQTIRRFFNEARATNEVRHPGIVQIYDCGTTQDGSPWLIMELLEGETLGARMARGLMSPREVIELGGQAASVLDAAHTAGIIHRDLKPDNLFIINDPHVTGGERVKVLDFGIAKLSLSSSALGMQTRTGIVMGTPLYMSPEQCRGTKQVDARSDIYSLGLLLYQMLAGQPPFLSDGIGELFDMHMNVAAPRLTERNPMVPLVLAEAIHRTLEKDPTARFQKMSDLQKALEAAHGAAAPAQAALHPRDTVLASTHRSGGTQVLPSSPTTLSSSTAEMASITHTQRVPRARALPLVMGGLVAAGVVAALVVKLQGGGGVATNRNRAPAPPTMATTTTAGSAAAAPTQPVESETDRAAGVLAATPSAATPPSPPSLAEAAGGGSIDVTTVPAEARVVDVATGAVLGVTPLRREIRHHRADLKIRIEKRGYLSRTAIIPVGRDFVGSFNLERVPAAKAEGGEKIIKL